MAKKKGADIHPPEFPDPLKAPPKGAPPGDAAKEEGAAKDAYLGEVAREEIAQQDEAAPSNGAVDAGDAAAAPVADVPGGPDAGGGDMAAPDPAAGVIASPTNVLKQITLGNLPPGPGAAGARVCYCVRKGEYWPAIVQVVRIVPETGALLADLTFDPEWGEDGRRAPVDGAEFGPAIGNWRFSPE